MDAAADRPEFAPPKQDAIWRGLALAILAHALLFVGLTQGLRWQRESQDAAVEAELWAAVPQEAAPAPPKPAPEPPKPVPEPPKPAPEPPKPVVKAPPAPDPQAKRDAQIALERERKQELERKQHEELRREREEQRKLEAKKKREEELAKKKEQARLVAEARRKEEEKKRKEQELKEAREAQRREQIRKEQIERSLAMAGTGSPSSTGAAARAAGPSTGWGARVRARVRPNIVFTELASGNPEAVVEVRLAPDGTIVGKRLKKSSGNNAWDEAVLRALDKTEVLPRDPETGRVPSAAELVFRPKD